MNDMLKLARADLHSKNRYYSKGAHSAAVDMTARDIQQAALLSEKPRLDGIPFVPVPDFVYICSRVRNLMSTAEKNKLGYDEFLSAARKSNQTDDVTLVVSSSNDYVARYDDGRNSWWLYVNDRFFYFIDLKKLDTYLGDTSHFKYVATASEVLMKLDLFASFPKYEYAHKVVRLVRDLIESDVDYELKVDIMKNYEAVSLMKSDVIGSTRISWEPIKGVISDMMAADNKISGCTMDGSIYLREFLMGSRVDTSDRPALQLLRENNAVTGTQLQQLSSIHKNLLFSEVDEAGGLEKFLSRVHTPRPVAEGAAVMLASKFKQQFVITFTKRHNRLPVIEGDVGKKMEIVRCFKTNKMKQLSKNPVSWWDDVELGQSIQGNANLNPLSFAKDKGALKQEVRYGPGDSIPELMAVITDPDYAVNKLDYQSFTGRVASSVEYRNSMDEAEYHEYAARGVYKEREQKLFGRLFCTTTIKNKHGLSEIMESMKSVLSYIPGEQMTITDKQRKKMLHEAAVLLSKPDHYSILCDIEGHNQSMQYENVGPLLKVMGDVVGKPDLDMLANYFSELTVYNYGAFEDNVTVSKGQLGGIEGWMNPVWTAHTTLVVALISDMVGLSMPLKMIYSDDVNIIARIPLENESDLTSLYNDLTKHFVKFGMILKASQTAISKNRVTLLRQHYFRGQRADSMMKRILSTSILNEDTFISEQMEIAGLNSSISSSLELTNEYVLPQYLKWYLAFYITLRSTTSYFEGARANTLLTTDNVPPELMFFVESGAGNAAELIRTQGEAIKRTIAAKLTEKIGDTSYKLTTANIDKHMHELYGAPMKDTISYALNDYICYNLLQGTYLREFMAFRLLMPLSLGGLGLDTFINQSISGHSNGFVKKVYFCKQLVKNTFVHAPFFLHVLSHSIEIKRGLASDGTVLVIGDERIGIDDAMTVSAEFPQLGIVRTSDAIINYKIKAYVKSICQNNELNRLFELVKGEHEFKKYLVDVSRKDFHFKIANYYYENSAYSLLYRFLGKVETSRTFVKKCKWQSSIREELYHKSLDSTIKLFSSSLNPKPVDKPDDDIISSLLKIRAMAFPDVSFSNITEPLYDTILEEDNRSRPFLMVTAHSGTKYTDYGLVSIAPEYGSEALYKGDKTEEHFLFDSTEKYLIYKLLIATKWIIYASKRSNREISEDLLRHNNIIQMCAVSLFTLCDSRYEDLEAYVKLPVGGEIYHRLKNMTYRTGSNIRILPNETVKTQVVVNQEQVALLGLEDSNINMDLCKFRFQLAHTLGRLTTGDLEISKRYKLKNRDLLHNVQLDFVREPANIPAYSPEYRLDTELNRSDFLQIEYLCLELITGFDDVQDNVVLSRRLLTGGDIKSLMNFEESVFQHYVKLKRGAMFIQDEIAETDVWTSFIEYGKDRFVELADLDHHQAVALITVTLRTYYLNLLKSKRGYSEKTDEMLLQRHLREHFGIEEFDKEYSNVVRYVMQYSKSHVDTSGVRTDDVFIHMTKKIRRPGEYLMRITLLLIIIKYALKYSIRENKVVIDLIGTADQLDAYLKMGAADFLDDPELTVGFLLYPPSTLINFLRDSQYAMIKQVAEASSQFEPMDFYSDPMPTSSKTGILVKEAPIVPNNLKSSVYSSKEINPFILRDLSPISKILLWGKHMSNIYAHPSSFLSVTRSDSWAAQYCLFRGLLSHDLVRKNETICDLTAGRGDGCSVLKYLGINHCSYAIRDDYTEVMRHEDVSVELSYDVEDPDTVKFSLIYDVVHIDISFTGKESCDPGLTISRLLRHGKRVCLRLNSIASLEKLFIDEDALQNSKCHVLFPGPGEIKPYQVYLFFTPNANNQPYDTEVEDPRSILMPIAKTFYESLTFENFATPALEDTGDSILHLINLKLPFEVYLTTSLEKIAVYGELDILTSLSSDKLHSRIFMIDARLAPYRLKEEVLKFGREGQEFNYRGMFPGQYAGSTQTIESMREHARFLQEQPASSRSMYYSDASDNLLCWLTFQHPVPEVRRFAKTHRELRRRGYAFDQMNPEDLEKRIAAIKTDSPAVTSFLSKNIREAITYLIYAKLINNYRAGLVLLWTKVTKNNPDHKRYFEVLKCYRRLSYLFTIWEADQVSLIEKDDWVKNFTGNYFIPKQRPTGKKGAKANLRLSTKDDWAEQGFKVVMDQIMGGISAGDMFYLTGVLCDEVDRNLVDGAVADLVEDATVSPGEIGAEFGSIIDQLGIAESFNTFDEAQGEDMTDFEFAAQFFYE